MNKIKLGQLIKDWRKQKGLSGQSLAALWGGNKSTVSQTESGNSVPGYEILSSLRRTGMSIDALIDEAEELNIVSEQATPYQPKAKYPNDLQHIIDEWPGLCDSQKAAVMSVMNAFSKQDTLSLRLNGTND